MEWHDPLMLVYAIFTKRLEIGKLVGEMMMVSTVSTMYVGLGEDHDGFKGELERGTKRSVVCVRRGRPETLLPSDGPKTSLIERFDGTRPNHRFRIVSRCASIEAVVWHSYHLNRTLTKSTFESCGRVPEGLSETKVHCCNPMVKT